MSQLELATLGAGCFWGVEELFLRLNGVKKVTSGYTGGSLVSPTYQDICTGTTGHAEVVQLEFDPSVVSYTEVLNYFWRLHDPTTLNRQGYDSGTQYRSAIFYHSDEQRLWAEESKTTRDKSGKHKDPIVTEITEISTFYPAEEHHQKYYQKKYQGGEGALCHFLRDE